MGLHEQVETMHAVNQHLAAICGVLFIIVDHADYEPGICDGARPRG